MEKIKIGMVGMGFGAGFTKLMTMHPDVSKVVAADMNETRRKKVCEPLGVESYDTMDEMLAANPDLNAVGIFAQRHMHGPLIIEALKRGLNVFSAVPISIDIDEIREIIALVEKTRLTCMIAETCFYFPDAIFCRDRYELGDFGKFVYGEAGYYHDITEFPMVGMERGIPPMFYPTHSMSMLFGAIDDKPVDVSCFGSTDPIDDDIYGKGKNLWDNPFANETAVFHMKKGGIAVINEMRRLGKNKPSSMINCLRGTKACYDTAGRVAAMDYGKLPKLGQPEPKFEYVSDEINTDFFLEDRGKSALLTSYTYSVGYSACQPVARLPKKFRDLALRTDIATALGHNGSHPFLVDDFVRAATSGHLPHNNAWESASYIIPGLIAHDSAMQNGATLPIPDFGEPPADWTRLDYSERIYGDDE